MSCSRTQHTSAAGVGTLDRCVQKLTSYSDDQYAPNIVIYVYIVKVTLTSTYTSKCNFNVYDIEHFVFAEFFRRNYYIYIYIWSGIWSAFEGP